MGAVTPNFGTVVPSVGTTDGAAGHSFGTAVPSLGHGGAKRLGRCRGGSIILRKFEMTGPGVGVAVKLWNGDSQVLERRVQHLERVS